MNLLLLTINPIAFSIGSIDIRWYGILIASGILLGYIVANKEADKRGLPKDFYTDFLMWAIPISIISARIYYVTMEWDQYAANPLRAIEIWNGGIAIHGGLIGAILTTIIYCKVKKISFFKVADITVPSLLIGQIIGRWGNFMNQEAHGGPVSRAFLESLHLPNWLINQMYIESLSSYVHPTFLYESLWNLVGLIIVLLIRKHLNRGEVFATYLIWYAIGRFYIEGMRTDSLYLIGELRSAQIVSILSLIVAIGLIVYRRFFIKIPTKYQEKF
ncbi:prolipoprotein diacylglyceryl transferase [Solibacillus sp. FSL W7-1436]|uniref:prolipoprotein diacylglyceryl transferase n=1 Tax=unclassified Solibacillus TaxID=2637870 RepID=UPI0030F87E44